MKDSLLRAENLRKTYRKAKLSILAMDGIDLTLESGEFVVIRGPSGSGKSTLLFALGAMLRPDSGRVEFGGESIYDLSLRRRETFRSQRIGFVFQSSCLLPYLTVRHNVLLGAPEPSARGQVHQLLERLGLLERADHFPPELSAGESQRAALARALIHRPSLLLADEPTGNLDPDNSRKVIDEFVRFRDAGGCVIAVTHGDEASADADRVLMLESGRFLAD